MSGADFLLLGDAGAPPGSLQAPSAAGRAPLTTSGPLFMLDGKPWRWKGVSAFKLLERFRQGESIDAFCSAYRRYNLFRIFWYTPRKDWGAQAWDAADVPTTLAFLTACAARGFYVELVLLTDDDPARLDPARRLVEGLAAVRPTNLVCEIGNEPITHKNILVDVLRSTLNQSGFLYSSGIYEDSSRAFGRFLTVHSARTKDWVRRAHDAKEFYDGGGPNAPSDPAHHVPIVLDEPARPDEVGGDLAQKVRDYRAYAGAAALMAAGATFHCSSAKFADLPNAEERACAEAFADGLDAFPADAPIGAYRRVVEDGNQPGGPTQDSRTYVVGSYMVRCQQAARNAPEPGWRQLDPDGVLWTR